MADKAATPAATPAAAPAPAPPAAPPPAAPPATPPAPAEGNPPSTPPAPAAPPPAAADVLSLDGGTPPADDAGKQPPKDPKTGEDTGTGKGAPETYADFKLPEGIQMDKAALEKFLPMAKGMNLSQEAAQQLVDLYAGMLTGETKAQADAFAAQQQTWRDELRADAEIGGDKFDASARAANLALGKLAKPEDMALIKASGLGSFPPLVRILARAGALMQEDKRSPGGSATTPETSAYDLYPSMRKP